MKRKILQTIANYTLIISENSPNEAIADYYYELACMVNAYAIEFHDIYLD